MLTARDIMEKNVISVAPDTDITSAAKQLLENHINGMPVLDGNGAIIGILCQSDLIFQQKEIPYPPIFTVLDSYIPLTSSQKMEDEFKKMSAVTVEQAMVKEVVTVNADTPVTEIAGLMVEKHLHTIPVVEDRKVIGIIGKEDVLKIMVDR